MPSNSISKSSQKLYFLSLTLLIFETNVIQKSIFTAASLYLLLIQYCSFHEIFFFGIQTEEIGGIRVKPNAWAVKPANLLCLNSVKFGVSQYYIIPTFSSLYLPHRVTSLKLLTALKQKDLSPFLSLFIRLSVMVIWFPYSVMLQLVFPWNTDFLKICL